MSIDFQREAELRTEPETFGVSHTVILLDFKNELAEDIFLCNQGQEYASLYRYFGDDKSYKGMVAIDVSDWDEKVAEKEADWLYMSDAVHSSTVEKLDSWAGWKRIKN